MTEPISYNDLAAFFSSNYGSTCETKSRIDRFYQDREVNYLECTTPVEDLSTFTITLPEDRINSFADLTCFNNSPETSNPAIMCLADNNGETAIGRALQIAFRKMEGEPLRSIGGFIFTDSPYSVFGRTSRLLDFLSSVDFGWYWVTGEGDWYSREPGGWYKL